VLPLLITQHFQGQQVYLHGGEEAVALFSAAL
jgi:hypothetical protein